MPYIDIIQTMLRISVFSTIYVVVLIFVSPMIDHMFSSLEEDERLGEQNIQILGEIIIHVIVLAVAWFSLHKFLSHHLDQYLGLKMKEPTRMAVDFISAIALVGLQSNLIDKLEYITIEHPFRFHLI
tara:strand:+ start:1309 stop:1689 length:381 start_codon:yes stop_codon:yes gene_type:complete